ncbi:hypothetical protein Sste5346_004812 [Sporothrix stenoceras]|uniref:Alpha-ketoglutarate-dependent sulfonate dioxygenase n=1 Tax=Sporothrix stenoceras TaxID=5173 RepID=A0ABR3Z694_9PEZI
MAPWSRKKKDEPSSKEKEALAEKQQNGATNGQNGNDAQPAKTSEDLPAYSAEAPPQPPQEPPSEADLAALTAILANLKLPAAPQPIPAQSTNMFDETQYPYPTPDEAIAHLQFLNAVHALKEEIGYTDGIFGLTDAMAAAPDDVVSIPLNLPDKQAAPTSAEDRYRARLSKVREKRWALFVARAVDRYEAWWIQATKGNWRLTEQDMGVQNHAAYSAFTEVELPLHARVWNADNILPLDVLMVMHAHMLNPRAYLEDCIRAGARSIWAAGMPWAVISACIDPEQGTFTKVTDEAKSAWKRQTLRAWDNTADHDTKSVVCPACYKSTSAPWTTCGASESGGNLMGAGYGDGGDGFEIKCTSCHFTIDRKALAVGKFVMHSLELIRGDKPMPGTILDPKTGRADAIPLRLSTTQKPEARTFPNRLIKRGGLMAAIVGGSGNGVAVAGQAQPLVDPMASPRTTSMEVVRERLEEILSDSDKLKAIDEWFGRYRYRPQPAARLAIRKMMSRYWDNASVFALDLTGAVLRQGIFIDKMQSIDWLHSPAARATMERILEKYKRFMGLLADHPLQVCVPTLDVDLGWHTHQLNPPSYYHTSVRRTLGKFIDHDDKIDEDKLHLAFEYTSKIYQEKYGEVYSECTCWYCEAVRAAHVSRVGLKLGLSKQGGVVENFHKSGAADNCPAPDRAAHVSAHNAVLFVENDVRSKVTRQIRAAQLARIESNYQKAVKRAAKNGRTLPPREQYYDHWGYSYFMYSPYVYPLYFSSAYYYAAPGFVPMGAGEWANCANGSCGSGGIAAGACGGPGGCGSCGSISGGCGGGCGGGGGGCGGGGGGGCGGGGGGGCGGGGGGGCGGGGC